MPSRPMESMESTMPSKFCRLVAWPSNRTSHTLTSGLFQDEFEMNLRLLGARTIRDVVPAMVDASNIHSHIVAVPHDQLYNANCTHLSTHLYEGYITISFQMRACNTHVSEMSRQRRNSRPGSITMFI